MSRVTLRRKNDSDFWADPGGVFLYRSSPHRIFDQHDDDRWYYPGHARRNKLINSHEIAFSELTPEDLFNCSPAFLKALKETFE